VLRVHLTSPSGATHELETVEDSERLLDLCDETSAPVLFSCRSGECGICALVVEHGHHALEPATLQELSTIALRIPGANHQVRLGCKVRLRSVEATVELRLIRT
jgi:ferredoxin